MDGGTAMDSSQMNGGEELNGPVKLEKGGCPGGHPRRFGSGRAVLLERGDDLGGDLRGDHPRGVLRLGSARVVAAKVIAQHLRVDPDARREFGRAHRRGQRRCLRLLRGLRVLRHDRVSFRMWGSFDHAYTYYSIRGDVSRGFEKVYRMFTFHVFRVGNVFAVGNALLTTSMLDGANACRAQRLTSPPADARGGIGGVLARAGAKRVGPGLFSDFEATYVDDIRPGGKLGTLAWLRWANLAEGVV